MTVTLDGTVLEQNKNYIVCYIFNLPDAEYYVAKVLVLGIAPVRAVITVTVPETDIYKSASTKVKITVTGNQK